ncbi:MAG: carboxypeptidase regulatory-like domain-containing protein [Bryobacteraceae bacterium]
MMYSKPKITAILALLAALAPAIAQIESTGTVLGLLTDPAGAVIPGVSVELLDTKTGIARTATTNASGRYTFVGVAPGRYSVKATAPGFQESLVPAVDVEVGKSYTVNLALQIGQEKQVIEVHSAPGAELQTLDATVGSTIGGETLMMLPTLQRNVTSLLLLQPTAMPQQGSSQNSTLGGQVAGARSDQNVFVLDGGNITNGTSGNSDYFTNFQGGPEGPIPTPVESIQEFRVATSNPGASFTGASGGETVLVTKRGGSAFHGSGYEYYQNAILNANRWDRNRLGQRRPDSTDHRFGGSIGGYTPHLPDAWKTYFYANYEGRRFDNNVQLTRLVPTGTLRQGILRFRDATGNIISYNLANARQCGAQGNAACDPRATGINPLVSKLWNQYLPAGNDFSQGDQLNTIGFSGPVPTPVTSDFGVVRLDHSFTSNWQLMGSYRFYREDAAVTRQTDLGGFLPGDKSGTFASTASIPRQPRFAVIGLTGVITPTLTTETNVNYLRDWWTWHTAGAPPQVPGTAAALEIGGETDNALIPVNIRTQAARTRTWDGHNYGLRENLSWQKGTHLMRFGGQFNRSRVAFNRDDGQTGSLTALVYQLNASAGINVPGAYRPPTCGTGVTTNCLLSSQLTTWNQLYAQVLGMVDQATLLGTRSADLSANPPGTPLFNNVIYDGFSFYATDSWHIRPSLTVSYGLNWSVDLPPTETTGKQALAVDESGKVIIPEDYLARREQAARNGQVYNPSIGFEPIKATGRKYPYDPRYNDFAPRISVAWNPKFGDGWLGRLAGQNKTVIRGGYSRLFDRLNGVQKVINGLQGFGFGQTLLCLGPSLNGQCLGSLGADPTNAFRVGIDGNSVPVPTLSTSVTVPLRPGTAAFPGANQAFTASSYQIDPHYQPAPNNQWDLTIQRELPGNSVLEIGYIRRTATHIYSPLDLNQVPFFMTLNGQSYAQAFDAVAAQIRAGSAIIPQPFFESALAGSALCKAPNTSCTAGVVSRFSGSFSTQQVTNVWNGIQPSFAFGQATASVQQIGTLFFWASQGWSRYNAGFVSYRTRHKGLSLDANFTFGHSLDTAGLNQDFDTSASNSYNLRYDYGTSLFDRKFVFNLLGLYQLPFGKGSGWWNYAARGWSVAPIFSAYSGLPLRVLDGSSQEFGQTTTGRSGSAVPIAKDTFGNSVHSGVAGNTSTQVGTAGDPGKGGSGLNLFANPDAVFNSFRPTLVSADTSTFGGGQLRGQNRWNLDLSIARTFKFNERWSTTFTGQIFNVFNVVQFDDPVVNLQRPTTFGVISTQLNTPRIVELGIHIDF